MRDFCIGIYLKTMVYCMSNSCDQKQLVGVIMHSLNSDFDETDDSRISNIVAGRKNPPKYIIGTARNYKSDRYDELVRYFEEEVIPLVDPNKTTLLDLAIKKIIDEDADIDEGTVVDVISGTTKEKMYDGNTGLGIFLAGTFLYALINTDNIGKTKSVKTIDDAFFNNVSIPRKRKETASAKGVDKNIVTDKEKVAIGARKFCMEYEDEIELLPLCQIADFIDPYHNNVRQLYSDYKLLPEAVKEAILDAKNVRKMDFSNTAWVGESLDEINKRIHELKLTKEKEFLYDGAKYFHRAYRRYADKSIEEYDTRIFKSLYDSEALMRVTGKKTGKTDLGFYMNQYLWIKKNNPRKRPKPPMDYLWELANLGNCDEEEMTFWVCSFIIESCYEIAGFGKKIEDFPTADDGKTLDVGDSHWILNTQEDLYFYALLQLYKNFYHK